MVGNGAFSRKIDYITIFGRLHNWFKSYVNFAERVDFFILDKVVKLVGGGCVINWAFPV